MTAPFPCTQCGRCCQLVDKSPQTQYLDRGDGTCKHFEAAHLRCGIYEQRPDICRVDRQFDLHYSKQMRWNEFVAINLRVCEALQSATLPPGQTSCSHEQD